VRGDLGIHSLGYKTQSKPDVASPKHIACVSVCQQVITMSAAGRSRQLGWLAILQIYCKCNRERQDGSPGAFEGEGRGTLLAVWLLSNLDRQSQLHGEIPTQKLPPAFVWRCVTAELEQPWLPTRTGETRCSSLVRNSPLPRACSMNAIFPTGCSKALLLGSILAFLDRPHETARNYYPEGMFSASFPLPSKSAGAPRSQHDDE